jgi:hypothetical protein
VGKLKTEEDENKTFNGEGKRLPNGPSLDTDGGGEKFGALAAEIEATGYNREDSGGVSGFSGQVGSVRRENADDDFNGSVVDAPLEPFDYEAEKIADHEAGSDEIGEPQSASGECGRTAVDDHGDGEFEGEEACGVVDEAFAFEDVDNRLREADALGYRGGGDGIGGGDDSAECETETPVESAEQPVGGRRDTSNGEGYESEGKKENADQVEFEIAPRGKPRGAVEERRKNDEEHEIGIERDTGNAGNEAEKKAGNDEDDGIGRLKFASEDSEDHYEQKKDEEDNLDFVDSARFHHWRTVLELVRLREKG